MPTESVTRRHAPVTRNRLALSLIVALAAAFAPAASACGAGSYTYAGMSTFDPTYGVGALVTPVGSLIPSGHVAGWVGLGGPGEGPAGTDEWIQVGVSSFPLLGAYDVYYEIERPGSEPVYRQVRANVPGGAPLRVAVLEMHARPSWWRVWLNGRPMSTAIHLPDSHHRWRAVATAESWDGGAPTCNDFLFRFRNVHVADAPGGNWQPAPRLFPIRSSNSEVISTARGSFLAAGGEGGARLLASTRR